MAALANPLGGKLKEGYLVKAPDSHKHLQQIKKWQKKWFRAHDNGDLHYYDSEKSNKPSGVIPLLQLYRIFDGKTAGVPLSYCVGLEGAGGCYLHYLKAESADIYNSWLRVLRGFAEVVEVTYLNRDGSPSTDRRDSSLPRDRRGSELPQAVDGERLRVGSTASVQGRHFTVTTKARFGKKEGWLAKTGSTNTGWKSRYFILTGWKLQYYKSEKADSPLGTVDLYDCNRITKSSGKKGFGLDVEVTGRVYNLSADSEVDQNEWLLAINQTLSVLAEQKAQTEGPLSRSGSTGSNVSDVSLGSRELLSEPSTSATPPRRDDSRSGDRSQAHSGGAGDASVEPLVLHSESQQVVTAGGRKEDGVVQLLEAEVDALRGKVSQLEWELRTSRSTIGQLHNQLAEDRRGAEEEARRLQEKNKNLAMQVEQTERLKGELETVNDSLRAQLEEYVDHVQELEDEQMAQKQELDEANASTAAAEEEVKVYHQELADAQQRLHEIEEVARQLEMALNSKDGDPQTPVYARMLMDSFTSSGKFDRSGSVEGGQPSPGSSPTLRRLKEMRDLQQSLQAVEKERDGLKASLRDHEAGSGREEDLEGVLSRERLKWQMEMANLRKEYESKLEQERKGQSKERTALEARVSSLDDAQAQLQETSRKAATELQQSLEEANQRISELEELVSAQQEKMGQLQVEKEKVLTDLIAIRKINSSMEKRISESEMDAQTASPVVSSSPVVANGDGPDLQQRMLKAEETVQELTLLLVETQHERDELRAQLEKLLSGSPNGIPQPDLNVHDMSVFGFGNKTRATTGTGHAPLSAAPVPVERSQAATTVLQHASQNGEAPPKPKRPPNSKELMSKYQSHSQQAQGSPQRSLHHQPRGRGGSFLQSIFSGVY